MGRGHEKKFFQRNGHRDSQQTYEKILNHQENANQNTMKYAVMPVRMVIIKKSQQRACARENVEKREPLCPGGGNADCAASVENMEISQKLKNRYTIGLSNSTSGYLSKKTRTLI